MSWEERWMNGDTPWDMGAAAPPLIDLLQNKPEYFKGDILVPGCGSGYDAVALSEKGYEVIGLDISSTALKVAKQVDTTGKVSYQLANFFTAVHDHYPGVQTVFEHTYFCAIHPSERESYRNACMRLLPPGGHWVAIIFLTPREEDDPLLGPPYQSREMEIFKLFSPYFRLVEKYVPEKTFPSRAGKELVMVWERI